MTYSLICPTVRLTCPVKPVEPVGRIEPSATFQAAPRTDSTVWVWLSPRSSECFHGTLEGIHGPDQTENTMKELINNFNKKDQEESGR